MADLIILNADIVTMDPSHPAASSLAVEAGRITHAGAAGPVLAAADRNTSVLDLGGKTLCPGFVDAHLHFRALAESFLGINLKREAGVHSIRDLQDALRTAVEKTPQEEWIRAAGYHEIHLVERRHPNRHDLDAVSRRHAIKLTHRSGYAHVLNTAAMERMGIRRHTPDPDGGIIDRDLDTGDPTGILYNMGEYLNRRVPPVDAAALETAVKTANRALLAGGVTSFQDASLRNDDDRRTWFAALKKNAALSPTVVFVEGFPAFQRARQGALSMDAADQGGVLQGGVKIIVDETTGRVLPAQEDLNAMVHSVHASGRQAVIHAIEQEAVCAALAAIDEALRRTPMARPPRHRIEHCAVCPPESVERIGALGIWVVTHPGFVYYNGDRYLETVPGEQRPFLYPCASLLKAGAAVAAASDAPVIPVDPLSGIYGGVTRMTASGRVLVPEEAVSPYDALAMHTVSAAAAGGLEQAKGAISEGLDADFVVLSGNPLKVRSAEIKNIRVLMTIVGGNIVWRRGERPDQ